MSHLESLIVEYLDWQGYLVRRNAKVGRLKHGGWEMELDVIGYNPHTNDLVHYEPSVDAHPWNIREARYAKKFSAAKKLIFTEVFSWLPPKTKLRQIAIFASHPADRNKIAGGDIVSIDQFIAEVREKVIKWGPARQRAIPENFPLLRTMQLSHCGYSHAV
ncbi:MAG: hypothetical protein E6Q43_02070 [Dokdonella sp.]|jgi:hypothetical protein|nr:MAG: hypothetical protein E6Q43_02070 [Dokdonella sp.]